MTTQRGRPKKDRSGQDLFENAEDYLRAVVTGETIPDAVRVQAARTLIQYETARKRARVKSPSPAQLDKKSAADLERSNIEQFEAKAEKIRAKYRKRGKL